MNYLHFGYGPQECLGREIGLSTVAILLKVVAGLKNLRPPPGTMGTLKSLIIGTERSYLTSDWAELTFDPTSESAQIYRHERRITFITDCDR